MLTEGEREERKKRKWEGIGEREEGVNEHMEGKRERKIQERSMEERRRRRRRRRKNM